MSIRTWLRALFAWQPKRTADKEQRKAAILKAAASGGYLLPDGFHREPLNTALHVAVRELIAEGRIKESVNPGPFGYVHWVVAKLCKHRKCPTECKPCYRESPGSELRFETEAEEDRYYARLYDEHGGCKVVLG